FDPTKAEFTSEAVRILDDVQFNPATGAANVSVSNDGVLVYRNGAVLSGTAAPPGVVDVIEVGGKRAPMITKTGRYSRPRFSPDGSQLALLNTAPNNRDVWVYDSRRDLFTRITFG